MTDESVFKLPFAEASEFFRRKLSVPTERWDDIWRDQHAKAFMSAGATKAELLADLRGAQQKAIDGKLTLPEFQAKFDQVVAKHGWSYNGGRNWRSELIFDTNITTAYQAGRWQQFREGGAEFLMYVHADGVMHPRPLHVAWHGTTLPIDDPWWRTHYPPNGWRCHCRAVRADRADWARAKGQGKGDAPTAPGNAAGIDPGWDYNVGEAAEQSYKVLAGKFETLPNDISRSWMAEHVAGPAFERFVEGKISTDFPVAVLGLQDMAALGTSAQTVWFSWQSLVEHLKAHPEIGLADYRTIPAIIDGGEVYQRGEERLIYLWQGEKLYRAALKKTRNGGENYFLSLFETTTELAKRQIVQKYERIR